MRILCSLSGIEFSCDHFPGILYSRECAHPVFSIPQKRLLSYTGKWSTGGLTSKDSYLLFLALLNSTELIEFRVPAIYTAKTDSIVAQNMERLMRAIVQINTVYNPAVLFSRGVISTDTRDLSNVHHWIDIWLLKYAEFRAGNISAHDSAKAIQREHALERMIRSPHKQPSSYAASLADWASVACEFPQFLIVSPFSKKGEKITQDAFWRECIIRCASDDTVFSVPPRDIAELLEHCEENLYETEYRSSDTPKLGSLQTHALFKLLRRAQKRHENYLGLTDEDLRKHGNIPLEGYTILSPESSIMDANIQSIANAAPSVEPKPGDFKSKFDFIRAKLRWDMAKKFGKTSEKGASKG